MAYFKITKGAKNKLKAKIQVSGKDFSGNRKVFYKTVYNVENLTEAKFKKYVNQEALKFENEMVNNIKSSDRDVKVQVLTFTELVNEWKENVKQNLSHNYYLRIGDIADRFGEYLKEHGLYNRPISDITVRDVQLFLNECAEEKKLINPFCSVKKPLPVCVSRSIARNLNNMTIRTANKICRQYDLDFDTYFTVTRTTAKYSQVTIRGYRGILRTIFNEAIRYDWISKNPVCLTKIGAIKNNVALNPISEKEVFSIKESQEFLKSLDKVKDIYINRVIPVKIMLLAGLRNGEVHGLKWSDIDFDKKVLHVIRTRLYSPEIGVYEKVPKTKTSIRTVPIPDTLIEDLKEYREWFKIMDDDFDKKLDQYYIAVDMYREPINPKGLDKWLVDFEAKTGQRHVTCHGLRHTYCSLLLSQNVPIQTVCKYMGHSDSTVTLRVYSHFIPDTQEIAVSALNNILQKEEQ